MSTKIIVNCNILFIFKLNEEKINNLRYAFEENKNKTKMTSFVCISSNGEVTCAELNSIGLKALNVSWDGTSSQQKSVSKILLSLDTLLLNSNTTNYSSFICSEKSVNESECNYVLF